jgi:tRNA(Ile2) C34 agmatinyltransferase TiaS
MVFSSRRGKHEAMPEEDKVAGAVVGAVAGVALGALLYKVFGPKCPKCNATIWPLDRRCRSCGRPVDE